MNFFSVYVPYAKNWIARDIEEFEAYELQRTILSVDRAVTWVVNDCKKEREFISNKILDR